MTTIILCGGEINYSDLPVSTNLTNSMIPVNGKPVIGWIVDDLIEKGVKTIVLVTRVQDERLRAFVERSYGHRVKLCLAVLNQKGSILDSLKAGLNVAPETGSIHIVLGDTLIRDSFTGDDFLYVGQVQESRRWCLVTVNSENIIQQYVDKKEIVNAEQYIALAGYYYLKDRQLLGACLDQALRAGEQELSGLLRRYGEIRPLKIRFATQWFDFGNIDNLIDARRRLMQPRFFNSLTVDPILNTITKISTNNEVLQDELDWYLNIPDEIKVLTPRISYQHKTNGQVEVIQEYYGYPTLAELYVYGELPADIWRSILRHALRIQTVFQRYKSQLSAEDIRSMYIDKTKNRLEELFRQDMSWEPIIKKSQIIYNETILNGVFTLWTELEKRVASMLYADSAHVIHGDFCFSNILYDVNNQIMRLIDPRGRFGKKGIFGDSRYDLAKLRHSVCEYYDYIIADLFEIKQVEGKYYGEIFAPANLRYVSEGFDDLIRNSGYDLMEIKLIEGLLFISMTPLHQGNKKRQMMMYLTGIKILNEVLADANCN